MSWFGRKKKQDNLTEAPVNISTSQELLEYILSIQGGMSEAGEEVSALTAMQDPTVFACVKVLAESVSQLPIAVMKQTGDRKEIVTQTDAHRILKKRPNSWMTSRQFRRLLVARTALEGNFIGVKSFIRGRVYEILPVSNHRVTIEQDDNFDVMYKIEMKNGTKTFKKDEIFHYYSLSLDGLSGLDPVALHKTHIGLSLAMDKFGARLFKNGALPRTILSTDLPIKEDQMKKIVSSMKEQTSGENAHSTYIVDGGFKPTRMAFTAEEAQFNETRKLMRSILAAIWRVPAHMVNDLEKATFSNIENLARQFVDYALMPWLVDLEDIYAQQLLTERERDMGYFIKHNVNALLRGDATSRANFYKAALGSMQQPGWMRPNEVRELEDLDKGPTELDEFMIPVTATPEDEPAPDTEPDQEEQEDDTQSI